MADFSELCPLFSTGVFNDVIFVNIKMTDISATGRGNALLGTGISSRGLSAYFTFGRTVIVTGGFVRRNTLVKGDDNLLMNHHVSELASGTEMGSVAIPISATAAMELATWVPFTMTLSQVTFTSNDVLGFNYAVGTAASGGIFDIIVRYKEK